MLHHEPKEADGNDAHKRFAGRLFRNARRALGARTTGLAELTTRMAAGCRTPATPPRAHTPRPNHHQLAPREGVREKSFIPWSTARTPRDSSRSPSSAMALECRPAEGHVGPPGRGRRRSSPEQRGAARVRGVVAKFGRGIKTQTGEIFQTFSLAGTAARQGFRVACPGTIQRARCRNRGLPGASPSILPPSPRPHGRPRLRGSGGGVADGRSGNRGTPRVPGSLPGRVATSRTAQLGD